MNTQKRLNQAFQEARIEYFDHSSKYAFFSDIHRGDDSVSDEFTRNQYIYVHVLDYYYSNGYTFVEAGDGDELWEHKNFKHIRLAHGDVFRGMKKLYDENRLIMMYGNHNIYLKNPQFVKNNYYYFYDEYNQSRVELFPGIVPVEALLLKQKDTQQEIFVVHGHQGDFINDQIWPLAMMLLRYFWRFMHVVGFENPSSPAKNLYKRHKVEKNYKKWITKNRMMLICGHTHRPKFPKHDELPYFNTGCCINTRGLSGIEIFDNQISLVDWRVVADDDGVMRIQRSLMRGPEPIERYDCRVESIFHGCKSNCQSIEDDE